MITNPTGFFKLFRGSKVEDFMRYFDQLELDADLTTQERKAFFLANVIVETGGFKRFRENMNYSKEQLAKVWPTRFSRKNSVGKYTFLPNGLAGVYAFNPVALANFVYADRMGNGSVATGDGYKFRGGGGLMATGEDMYAKLDRLMFMNGKLLALPDMLMNTDMAAKSAGAIWFMKKSNEPADRGDPVAVRKSINGGTIGLKEMIESYNTILPFV